MTEHNKSPQQPARLTGAEIVWATLVGEGVTDVFGYPGGAILPVYDALRKFPIHHTLVRHEQGAAHMADGYSRASGKVGVAIATSGPGATNLVTGIATAMLDSIPIVCITGNVSSKVLGSDAFQEVDITGIITSSSAAPRTLRRRFATHFRLRSPRGPARCSLTSPRTRSKPRRSSTLKPPSRVRIAFIRCARWKRAAWRRRRS
jgi:hypothetical protein